MYCGLGVIGGYSLSPGVVYRGVHWRFCWLIYCIFYLATKSQNGVLVYGSSLYNDGALIFWFRRVRDVDMKRDYAFVVSLIITPF